MLLEKDTKRAFDLPETKMKIYEKWERTLNISLEGKLGGEVLKEIVDVDFSADDTVKVTANLGSISSHSVDFLKFMESLTDR